MTPLLVKILCQSTYSSSTYYGSDTFISAWGTSVKKTDEKYISVWSACPTRDITKYGILEQAFKIHKYKIDLLKDIDIVNNICEIAFLNSEVSDIIEYCECGNNCSIYLMHICSFQFVGTILLKVEWFLVVIYQILLFLSVIHKSKKGTKESIYNWRKRHHCLVPLWEWFVESLIIFLNIWLL